MKELTAALKKAQLIFKPLQKTAKNPFFKSNYATLDDCIEATRSALAENGLCVVQPTLYENGVTLLITKLLHESGQEITSSYPIIPTKQDPQGYGSALTYARRYVYCSILGLVAEEDDDGNAASKETKTPTQPAQKPTGVISAAQLTRLKTIASKSGKAPDELKAIIAVFGYESSKDIRPVDYEKICEEIEKPKHQLGD